MLFIPSDWRRVFLCVVFGKALFSRGRRLAQ